MKKKCMIYGNCQHTHLEHFLEQSEFVKYFDMVKVKDVYARDKTFLDDATLLTLDCFIYQHVSAEFDSFFSTDAICDKLRPDCIRIAIPNFWLSVYYPQHIYHPVVRPNRKYSISPSGIFPYGDANINALLVSGVQEASIIKLLSDPDYYDKNAILTNSEKSFSSLESREKEFRVDIPSVAWLRSKFTQIYLCVTVNHPLHDYFEWLANSILRLLDIQGAPCVDVNVFPFSHNHIHVPIYPSVIKHLGLSFLASNHRYLFYSEKHSWEQYIRKYIAHATGSNISGRDSIGIAQIGKVLLGDIKLLPCPQSRKKVDELKTFFTGYEKFNPDMNVVICGEKVWTHPARSSCKEIPGLCIEFDGVGNVVWLDEKSTFNNSYIRLHSNGYIYIGKSRFGGLSISNAYHCGGGCFIDDGVIAQNALNIQLLGHNFCTIGKDCIFADRVKIMCSDGHTLFDGDRIVLNANASIHVGNHVWIGYASTLLKGTVVPDGCQVGAGSLVNKAFEETNAVLAGVPARCIRTGVQWAIENPENFM